MNHSPAHTPKLGATIHYLPSFRNGTVSIHAPAWGVTVLLYTPTSIIRRFNPRSRVGSDKRTLWVLSSLSEFQSTLPHGERLKTATLDCLLLTFQSTLPHGERRSNRLYMVLRLSFNPRSRMGSDLTAILRCEYVLVSIHAPAWGATIGSSACIAGKTFQSTLPRGERPRFLVSLRRIFTFQSTLPRGERHNKAKVVSIYVVSIHAPTWGATTPSDTSLPLAMFQSTLPRGERRL